MKKPFKVLTSSALAATLAVSAITPAIVLADENAEEYVVQDVVFLDGDKLAEIPFEDYSTALEFEEINDEVMFVRYPNGKTFKFEDYSTEFDFADYNPEETYKSLLANSEELTDKIYEGYIDEDGKVRVKADEQPEDRLNETFFYNVA